MARHSRLEAAGDNALHADARRARSSFLRHLQRRRARRRSCRRARRARHSCRLRPRGSSRLRPRRSCRLRPRRSCRLRPRRTSSCIFVGRAARARIWLLLGPWCHQDSKLLPAEVFVVSVAVVSHEQRAVAPAAVARRHHRAAVPARLEALQHAAADVRFGRKRHALHRRTLLRVRSGARARRAHDASLAQSGERRPALARAPAVAANKAETLVRMPLRGATLQPHARAARCRSACAQSSEAGAGQRFGRVPVACRAARIHAKLSKPRSRAAGTASSGPKTALVSDRAAGLRCAVSIKLWPCSSLGLGDCE